MRSLHLVSGTGGGEWVWSKALRILDQHFAFHHHDCSPEARIEEVADRVAGALDPESVLIAHSLGSVVTLDLLIRHSDICSGAILVSSTASADPPTVKEARNASLSKLAQGGLSDWAALFAKRALPERAPASTVECVLEGLCSHDPATIARQQRMVGERTDRQSQLADIKCPITLITGQHDPITPFKEVSEMASRLPQVRARMMKGCSHFPMLEQPNEFARLCNSALAWIDKTGVSS